jgi:hypothetical protein
MDQSAMFKLFSLFVPVEPDAEHERNFSTQLANLAGFEPSV